MEARKRKTSRQRDRHRFNTITKTKMNTSKTLFIIFGLLFFCKNIKAFEYVIMTSEIIGRPETNIVVVTQRQDQYIIATKNISIQLKDGEYSLLCSDCTVTVNKTEHTLSTTPPCLIQVKQYIVTFSRHCQILFNGQVCSPSDLKGKILGDRVEKTGTVDVQRPTYPHRNSSIENSPPPEEEAKGKKE